MVSGLQQQLVELGAETILVDQDRDIAGTDRAFDRLAIRPRCQQTVTTAQQQVQLIDDIVAHPVPDLRRLGLPGSPQGT